MTPLLIGLLCAGLLVAAYERGHGHLHLIKAAVDPQDVPVVLPTGPGGQAPVRLSRSATTIGGDVEFLSVTLLPGRGMNVFQITATVPGRGEVNLLASPALGATGGVLSGVGDDANGAGSTTLGGAFLAPWAGRLSGRPVADGMLEANWQDAVLSLPPDAPGASQSVQGLLLKRGANKVTTANLPDGQAVEALFHAGSFDGHWPSSLDVTVRVELTAKTVNLIMTATNTGTQPTPCGLGWQPLFAIPSGDRANAVLRVGSREVVEMDRTTGLPTGRMTQVEGTSLDLSRGMPLGSADLDATYADMGAGQWAELDDRTANVALRIGALDPGIAGLRVRAPADKGWVSLGPETNFDDALGPEWRQGPGGLTTLPPGASMEWKVQLGIAVLGAGGK